jgi:hypothetical protein
LRLVLDSGHPDQSIYAVLHQGWLKSQWWHSLTREASTVSWIMKSKHGGSRLKGDNVTIFPQKSEVSHKK